jgi:hypothetical protein
MEFNICLTSVVDYLFLDCSGFGTFQMAVELTLRVLFNLLLPPADSLVLPADRFLAVTRFFFGQSFAYFLSRMTKMVGTLE